MRVTANRVPRDFFLTSGVGESDITVHAGSYHLALREAGIEMANIVTYSSILPAEAVAHPGPPWPVRHGEVMECIQAIASCEAGQTATTGLIYGWLYDDDFGGRRYGGLVCEYGGDLPEQEAAAQLRKSLDELHVNGYQHLRMEEAALVTRSVTPRRKYGTAGVWLCFTSHVWPEVPA